ncbi:MAG: amidohydrolase, partial [Candidatus Aminicenantes bacterium]|nr:amidohydrolase [Candidatus Aminicenantes bacterium]
MKRRYAIAALLCAALAAALPAPFRGASDGLLLRNGNILTVGGPVIEGGDILVAGGKIVRLGRNLQAPDGVRVLDLDGRWVMPGIIDSHAHIAIEGGVNESGDLMTPETDIRDVINPEDLNIYYALTGGVTTVHTMHGSANPIGGRGLVLKLRWGKNASEMIFRGAPPTVKWALGENPKQSNFQGAGPARYPRTRMGVEASIRLELDRAREYMKAWADYEAGLKALKKGEPRPLPPRRDTRLEVVADMLRGKYLVRCHAYQSEEMLSIMKLCREYGLKLAAFEHGLEGYRIADELVSFGVGVTTFADFWAYKWEAYNTLPHAAALMARRGVLTAVNAD